MRVDRRGVLVALTVLVTLVTVDAAVTLAVLGVPNALPRGPVDGTPLLPLAVVGVVLLVGASRPDPVLVREWRDRHGLPDDPATRSNVAAWLQRTRTARAVGFASSGFGMTAVWLSNVTEGGSAIQRAAVDAVIGMPSPLLFGIGGYALGAVVAEVGRRRPGGRVAVDLRPRVVAAFTAPLARTVPRALGATTLVIGVIAAMVGVAALPAVLASVAVLTVLEGVRAWLVRRPQRADDAAALALDDAQRASTVQAVSGSAIALLAAATADLLSDVALATSMAWLSIVGLVISWVGLGLWLGHGLGLTHRVRRSADPKGASTGSPVHDA